jgi:hypothetical protein
MRQAGHGLCLRSAGAGPMRHAAPATLARRHRISRSVALPSNPMSRLHSAFARLFLPDPASPARPAPTAADLLDEQGCTRVLVLELAAPADWDRLRTVWEGVQSDLGLPAPAIAVSGVDGIQLWFSAPAPVSVADARRWLEALCLRYLPGVAAQRLRLFPRVDAEAGDGAAVLHAEPVPTVQPDGERWSAFVAPDLVPLFAETPWLDSEPSEEGQAALLERVGVMKAGWFEAGVDAGTPEAGREVDDDAAARSTGVAAGTAAGWRHEAAAFLQRVMNDETAPWAVRVEAAKALLHAPNRVDAS